MISALGRERPAPGAESQMAQEPSATSVEVGVMLPASGASGDGRYQVASAARGAEELGFCSVWTVDHLAFHIGSLEPVVTLAAVATITEHVQLGFGVMLAALRHPAWIAKQLASLQVISGDRVLFGVGVGGENPVEWAAAGVPVRQRGRRTDRLLEVLPTLVTGREAELPAPWNARVPPLAPAGAAPPIWIGGRSEAAIERAARFGDGWLAAWVPADQLAERQEKCANRARELGRTVPRTGIALFVNVDDGDPAHAASETAGYLKRQYGEMAEKIMRYAIVGTSASVGRELHSMVAGGAELLVLVPASGDWRTQYRRLASIRRNDLPY